MWSMLGIILLLVLLIGFEVWGWFSGSIISLVVGFLDILFGIILFVIGLTCNNLLVLAIILVPMCIPKFKANTYMDSPAPIDVLKADISKIKNKIKV